MAPEALNVALRLRATARRTPEKKALLYPTATASDGTVTYGHRTFRELDEESDARAHALVAAGITRGVKTILMVKPGPELFSLCFALFKIGAVPVIVDPGMGASRMLHCYKAVAAEAFVGIPVAHAIRVLYPRVFSSLKTVVTVGRRWLWGGHALDRLLEASRGEFPVAETSASNLVAINFTTGSTGPARGVEYTHRMADATVRHFIAHYATSECVTLATLPLFGLFDMLAGFTTVLPPMDPTKPALVDPRKMIRAMEQFQVTHMFASPAFLHRVGEYARDRQIRLPSLRGVLSGGAPVQISIVECFRGLLSEGATLDTTYGATEALPIATIESAEILRETQAMTRAGKGTCVGEPVAGVEARIIAISDEPVARWSGALLAGRTEVGEIVIRGANVSVHYHGNPEANALMKIADESGPWHRTGDLGWMDEKGRLWFAGRKSQRVESSRGPLFTVQWEGVFNAHPDVLRTALVGVGHAGQQAPVICVELRRRENPEVCARIADELSQMAAKNPLTQGIKAFLFHPGFPVDIRHNAKIGREELAAWAEAELARPGAPRDLRRAALSSVPLAGWAFLVAGLIWPFENGVLQAFWLIDVALSVGVHGLQLLVSVPKGRKAGYGVAKIVILTFVFGATWWKLIKPVSLGTYPAASG